jgi:hypothetical protein
VAERRPAARERQRTEAERVAAVLEPLEQPPRLRQETKPLQQTVAIAAKRDQAEHQTRFGHSCWSRSYTSVANGAVEVT